MKSYRVFRFSSGLMATLLAGFAAFSVYACMYAYRKPFTAAGFDNHRFWGIEYKVWLIIAQTIGYTASKFFGIGFIGGMKKERRPYSIIKLISLSWISLFFFGVFPPPYNIIFILLNGFPLGVIYGLVFSYIEGRRSTELLGALLAASFIFASGFAQSAGKYILLAWNVSEWWMPWVTGLIFFPPLLFFTWLLSKTPEPDAGDRVARTPRAPMSKRERRAFIQAFFPGLALLVAAYVMLTIIRDYRSNFASNIWTELGYGKDALVFTRSELPASLLVLALMGGMVLVRNNMKALLINHGIVIGGFVLAAVSTVLFMKGLLGPFWWMTVSGMGLYAGYVPFNCMLFERLIAGFRYAGNAGFVIYVADSFGYLGSDAVLLVKSFWPMNISWTDFFINLVLAVSGAGILLVWLAASYFRRKQRIISTGTSSKLGYV